MTNYKQELAPYHEEQLEVVRRTAERGLRMAQEENQSRYADVFQHLLDELKRARSLI